MPNRSTSSAVAISRVHSDGGGSVPAAPDQSRSESETDLMRLFGLSPRQSTLTALLLSGRSIKEAADALGITEGSARQYLKGIFRKTGARRQADLVRIVLSALAPQA